MLDSFFARIRSNSRLLSGDHRQDDPQAQWNRFLFQWLGLSLILHLIAAVFSSGFYHSDEHFQIIEFLNYKLGRSSVSDLPLEFGQQMRPWLLPAIYFEITNLLKLLGITDPFDWALAYRLFASVWGWISLAGLCLCSSVWFSSQKLRRASVILMCTLWCLPSLHARHSSENLAGSFFFIGLSLLVLKSKAKELTNRTIPHTILFVSGIFLGFSFEFRYQVGAFIVGFILWLLLVGRLPLFRIWSLFAGMAIPIALGTWTDHWGYGQWTFSPWNYLKYNIIDHHVTDSDSSPAWDYFRRALTESWPIIGFLTLVSFPIAWIRNPKHILTWSLVPFFILHELIGHKELRFLFPMAHVGGIILVQATEGLEVFLKKATSIVAVRLFFLINIAGLITLLFVPAWTPIRFYSKLYHFKPKNFRVYFQDDRIINLGGATLTFYRPDQVPFIRIENYSDFAHLLKNTSEPIYLFYPRTLLPVEAESVKQQCHPEFSALPQVLETFIPTSLANRITNWTLFRCEKNSTDSQLKKD